MNEDINRRPLKTRQHIWAHRLAHWFVARGLTPNQMSMASIALAVLGAFVYAGVGATSGALRSLLLFMAAVFIQLRLLSNMLDGLMAVEEGRKTATGAIYNELPDRIADIFFLVAAGYAADCAILGWSAALLAVLTAYVRALGGALGFAQDFCGPMAKPHRMFTLTLGNVLAIFLPALPVLGVTLGVIIVGSAATVWRRTMHLATALSDQRA